MPGWILNLGARTATSAVIDDGRARLRRAIVPTPGTWPSAPRTLPRLPWNLLACLALLLPASALTQQTLVPFGAAWRYRKGTNEVSSPISAWRSRGFDAATWPLGPSPFSYGDGLTTGTTLSDMRGGYTCVFLRREFVVPAAAELTALRLLVDYDDGFVAWLNDVEIARAGVQGEPLYRGVAASSHEGGTPITFNVSVPLATLLVTGTNVLAVQAFNRDLSTSTDFRLDAALEADRPDGLGPVVSNRSPEGAEVAVLTQITVLFSEPVTGVAAGDLLVNDRPATWVVGMAGSDRYTFSFPQPAPGLVAVAWNETHRITDLQGNPFNTEDPGSTWSYSLGDTVPPQIRATTPTPGAVVSRFSQIEVLFTEPVQGLDAADLLINGQPAAILSGADAGPYLFQFSSPGAGPVHLSWASAHGVTDLAPTPNPLADAGWTVTFDPSLAPGDIVLNEFVAANETGLRDEDGETQDWIEIHNRGQVTVDLLGWSLTDDAGAPGKWTFPSRRLAPGEYLVVFASGKDRRAPTGANRFHTNFRLGTSGEYLGLENAESPRIAVSELKPGYPEQRRDVSYGRTSSDTWQYFSKPSPGAANGTSSIVGVAPEPRFSVGRGAFTTPFDLELATTLEGASIRYTLDGSEPTATTGLAYTDPVRITTTATIRAATFREGYLPSRTRTHSFLFPDDVVHQPSRPAGFPATWGTWSGFPNNQVPADYEMDLDPLRTDPNNPASPLDPAKMQRLQAGLRELPLVSVVMRPDDLFGANGLYPRASDGNKASNEKACSIEMILPDGSTAFATEGGLDLHGNASRSPLKNPKHGFKLSFKSDYGPTSLRYRLFPDSPVETFDDLILRADFNTSWRHWSDSSGNGNGAYQRSRGTRTRFAWSQETFRAMGHAAPHTRFFHLFLNGLYWGTYDFTEQPTEQFAASYYGGRPGEHDIYDQGALQGGTAAAYNAMTALGGLDTLAGYERMKQYLDLPEFMDYMLLHFFVGHQDWGNAKNWYAVRPRAAGLPNTFKYLPWDQECILLEENVSRVPKGGGDDDAPSGLHAKLDANPQYRLDFADRVFKHLVAPGGALTAEATIARWQKWQALMDKAIVAESCRWGDYRRDVHRYADGTFQLYTREQHWLAENQRLVNSYFVHRGAIVLAQLRTAGLYPNLDAPRFNLVAGPVAAGATLSLSAPEGSILYTLDGTDPRVYGTGAISPTAITYRDPVVLDRTATVKARASRNGTWSALNEATFTVNDTGVPLCFTEIMYHPPEGEAYEFLELENVGVLPLDVSGFSLRGVEFVFPANTVIPPAGLVVLSSSANPTAFAGRYPDTVVLGTYGGSLDNGGERLAIVDRHGRTVTAVHYDDEAGWPVEADGAGYSLEVVDPRGDPNAPANWRASRLSLGSPGRAALPLPTPAVLLNEVMADNQSAVPHGNAHPDWLELHNPGDTAVSLANWSLTDDDDRRKFVFPDDTSVPAGGYLVVWCDNDSSTPGLHTGFALDRDGESLWLYDAATNRADALSFGRQVADRSIGRVETLWQLTEPTPEAANRAATLADPANLTLNEWLAAPEPGNPDWIELFNRAESAPVSLRGLHLGTTNDLDRLDVLAFLGPREHTLLFADEQPGPAHLEFKLPAGGGVILLQDPTGRELERVTYGPQIRAVSEGRLPDAASRIVAFTTTVSPGAPNHVPLPEVVINEVLSHADPPLEDAIELHNPGAEPVVIGGWYLSDDPRDLTRFRIPDGTHLDAGGYAVFYEAQFGAAEGEVDLPPRFALDAAHGDAVYLAEADANGNLTGRRTGVFFGAAANGISFGRVPTSVGVNFAALSRRTFGQDEPPDLALFRSGRGLPNAGPLVGPIVISEVMYQPIPGLDAPADGSNLEFIELHNLSGVSVPLFDPEHPENPWRLAKAVTYSFPANTTLPGHASLLLVPFDPRTNAVALASFNAAYAPVSPLLGPYAGRLANEGDTIELERPDTPQPPDRTDAGFVPYVLVERILYSPQSPWPTNAAGGGASLQRLTPAAFANDPANWTAAPPTPGRVDTTDTDTDSDGDGMPDAWESEHQTNPVVPDAVEDPDGDGSTNFDEYRAGTDPHSVASVLALQLGSVGTDRVTLEFIARPARRYAILYRDQLDAGPWVRLADITAAEGERTVSVQDTAPRFDARFYRVVLETDP